ncbi:hypothetical protein [Marinibacterium profundimaris]|uniref:hypothetical protein n=1 Tax=Marinibacterium profundimaris TaxID=1679460 RepID=UPI000B522E20|nr:hypothetical protein [Marinibacterium profundimaris]
MAAGLDPALFWALTLREYHAHMMGARDRIKAEQDGRAWLAWHAEALHRQEKLPSFRAFLGGGDRGPQSAADLQTMFDVMAAQWGAKPAA